jgi:hypothetical protein
MTRNPLSRLRQWIARVRAIPTRVEQLDAQVRATDIELRQRVDALGPFVFDVLRNAATGLDRHIDETHAALERQVGLVEAAVGEQGSVTRAALESERADEVAAELVASLGPSPSLRSGLSIFTITWNHAEHLPDALASGIAALDALGDRAGELLVLDNASTDHTPGLLAELAERDERVRVIRAPVNLGLSRARNVLLHACEREHALMLDADNLAATAGVVSVYDVARERSAMLTYGVLLWRDAADGAYARFGSAGPLSPATLARLDIDTFAVVDVAGIRRLGGWTLDPELHAFDDQELVRRIAYERELVVFVPVVLGTYHITHGGHSRTGGDVRPRRARVERMYATDDATEIPAAVVHPELGALWSSPAAVRGAPELRPRPIPAAPIVRSRVLVVAPGGVGNLGDDLITAAIVERVKRCCPDHDVELVTDGASLAADLDAVAWLGTLEEVVAAGRDSSPESWSALDLGRLDLVVLAGGGNLNSLWHHDLVPRRQRLVDLLNIAGVPIVASGQGIGPFTDDDHADAVRELLGTATAIAVRDDASCSALAAMGIAADRVGDDALGAAPADSERVAVALSSAGVDPGLPIFALHVRDAPYVGIDGVKLAEWASSIDAIAAARGAQVVGVALNCEGPDPEPIALLRLARERSRRAPWRILDDPTHPASVFGALRRAERALVSSYHAALVCIEARVPTVYCAGTDYARQKAEGLRGLAGLPREFVVGPGVAADELVERLALVEHALEAGAGLSDAADAVERWHRERLAPLVTGIDRRSA